ncbi:MAG TPA: hypothetical protein VFQ99_03230 [Gallionella sp.]|nr:hypothetical protein [Gallionella sp.]
MEEHDMRYEASIMLIGPFTHPLAIALQLFAIIMALRLIPLTGRAKAWLVFSTAFVLMGVRRAIELLEHFDIIHSGVASNNLNDLIALITSTLMALGVYLIREVFEERAQAQQKMQQQLDELLRFQKLTVGRELRMKELMEENAALRQQIAAAQPDDTQT